MSNAYQSSVQWFLQDKIQYYLSCKMRCSNILDQLIRLLANMRSSDTIMKILRSARMMTVFQELKWLILCHKIINDGRKVEWAIEILQEIIPNSMHKSSGLTEKSSKSLIVSKSNQNKKQKNDGFNRVLTNKLLEPYRIYLYKRSIYSLDSIDAAQHKAPLLLSLLTSITNISEILFTLGRYLYSNNLCLADFNVQLGIDASNLYFSLKCSLNTNDLVRYLRFIQKINEGMLNVYFNCYFNKDVGKYAPSWIQIDNRIEKQAKKQNQIRVDISIDNSCRGLNMSNSLVLSDSCQSVRYPHCFQQKCEQIQTQSTLNSILSNPSMIDQQRIDLIQCMQELILKGPQ